MDSISYFPSVQSDWPTHYEPTMDDIIVALLTHTFRRMFYVKRGDKDAELPIPDRR